MDDEPPRIARLRAYMVEAIPYRPAHREEARRELGQLPFIKLLHAYLKWTYRFVPPHPRKVGLHVALLGVRGRSLPWRGDSCPGEQK
jgi:hypothetical protein